MRPKRKKRASRSVFPPDVALRIAKEHRTAPFGSRTAILYAHAREQGVSLSMVYRAIERQAKPRPGLTRIAGSAERIAEEIEATPHGYRGELVRIYASAYGVSVHTIYPALRRAKKGGVTRKTRSDKGRKKSRENEIKEKRAKEPENGVNRSIAS